MGNSETTDDRENFLRSHNRTHQQTHARVQQNLRHYTQSGFIDGDPGVFPEPPDKWLDWQHY